MRQESTGSKKLAHPPFFEDLDTSQKDAIIREGSLNAYRFGNVLLIRVDDFEKFVQERRIRRDEDK
jgi:hypothetical protein